MAVHHPETVLQRDAKGGRAEKGGKQAGNQKAHRFIIHGMSLVHLPDVACGFSYRVSRINEVVGYCMLTFKTSCAVLNVFATLWVQWFVACGAASCTRTGKPCVAENWLEQRT
jgi:hypothetical protein